MCGIAGLIGVEEPEGVRITGQMVSALARRGPDSEGIAQWPGAVLGHRRLAILDLSAAGHQPMLSTCGSIGIVFNGCIYNFQQLRTALEAEGHRFRSNCDTEVLLRGYEHWGIDELLRRAHGMFAFGIWDNRMRKLTLVRDRLGVKPLLYAVDGGKIAFASTVPALRCAGFGGDLDPQAVLAFLEFGYVPEAHTIYQGLNKIPAGGILEWQEGRIQQRSYWELPAVEESSPITFEEAVEETERLLIEAVRLRLISDVPIGALLSAGIDSTLVCVAMAKLNAKIRAFTVSTPGDEADEAGPAAATARQLGIAHEIVILPARQPELDDLSSAYGEPFGCSSALAMLQVSRAVKPFATVLLTGDGGDDVFLGYPFHRHFWMAQRLARTMPRWSLDAWSKWHRPRNGFGAMRRPLHFLDYASGGLGAVTRVHDGLPFYDQHGLRGPRLKNLQLPQRLIPLSSDSGRRLLSDVLHYEQNMRFAGEFLTKVDGGAMHYALEARSPFLDHGLWEFAARLPFSVRLHGGKLKAILREIVRRHLGAEAAFRKKRGFTIPVERWLTTRWKSSLDQLMDARLAKEAWIRQDSLTAVVRQSLVEGTAPTQLWYLTTLEHWLRKTQ